MVFYGSWRYWDENDDSRRDGDPPWDSDHPRDADCHKICLATLYDFTRPHFNVTIANKTSLQASKNLIGSDIIHYPMLLLTVSKYNCLIKSIS